MAGSSGGSGTVDPSGANVSSGVVVPSGVVVLALGHDRRALARNGLGVLGPHDHGAPVVELVDRADLLALADDALAGGELHLVRDLVLGGRHGRGGLSLLRAPPGP